MIGDRSDQVPRPKWTLHPRIAEGDRNPAHRRLDPGGATLRIALVA